MKSLMLKRFSREVAYQPLKSMLWSVDKCFVLRVTSGKMLGKRHLTATAYEGLLQQKRMWRRIRDVFRPWRPFPNGFARCDRRSPDSRKEDLATPVSNPEMGGRWIKKKNKQFSTTTPRNGVWRGGLTTAAGTLQEKCCNGVGKEEELQALLTNGR